MGGELSQVRGKPSTHEVAWRSHCREGCLPGPDPALCSLAVLPWQPQA